MNKLIFLIVPMALLCGNGCDNADPVVTEKTQDLPVRIITVSKEKRTQLLRFLGTVETDREAKLSFKIGGKIAALHFEDDQWVKKGEFLAELDTRELLATKEKALENKKKTKRDLERMEKLHQRNIVPLSSSQDAESAYVLASAELKRVEDHLRNAFIRAPFSGRIREKLAEVSEVVGSGVPVAILTSMDPILIKITVSDHDLRYISKGMEAQVFVDTFPDTSFAGTVRNIGTSADTLSRSFQAEILVHNKDEKLRPGQIARIHIRHETAAPSIFIPMDCILGFGDNPYVYEVAEGRARRLSVKVDRFLGEEAEITEGLAEGDCVVISGQEYLREGLPVRVVEE